MDSCPTPGPQPLTLVEKNKLHHIPNVHLLTDFFDLSEFDVETTGLRLVETEMFRFRASVQVTFTKETGHVSNNRENFKLDLR